MKFADISSKTPDFDEAKVLELSTLGVQPPSVQPLGRHFQAGEGPTA